MSLLRKIWGIYGSIIFFLLWLIFFPLYFFAFTFLPKKAHRQIIWFSHQVYTRLFFIGTFIFVRVKGRAYLDAKQSYILVSNHVSNIDFMVNAYAYPKAYKYLAKMELAKVPLFGYVVRHLCVLVNRKNTESRRKSILYLQQTLKEGFSVMLYPEGTRNLSEAPLGDFKNGAFRIAIQTQTPIAVQTLVNVHQVAGRSNIDLFPGVIEVNWSPPIETKGMTPEDLPRLKEMVRQQMLAHLNPAFALSS